MDQRLDRIETDMNIMKVCVKALEGYLALMLEGIAHVNQRLNGMDNRIAKIERHLDLVALDP